MKGLVTGFSTAALLVAAGNAQAVVLDGSIAGDGYGSAVSVQSVQTQFGDNFSELNAAYAQVSGGVLYIAITGNLESNFNKLNIFIDSVAGGENVLTNDANNGGNNPENDGWAGKHAGMTFDSGFAADFMLIMRNGFGPQFDVDFATVGGGLGAFEVAGNIFGGSLTGSNAAALPGAGIGVAFDNSNVAGIAGGTGAADPLAAQAVTTGIELAIPLSAIGNPNIADIKVSAMVNGSNHDFLSNQFLGGLPADTGNLGGNGAGGFTGTLSDIDLNQFAGNQYFQIPEPASVALLGLGGLAMLRRRA